jgi:hypothetical protein
MTGMRIAILAAAAAAVVVLFLVFRPGDDDEGASAPPPTTAATTATTPTQPTTPTETEPAPPPPPPQPTVSRAVINVRGGEPVGGIRRLSMHKDRRLILVVTADVSDHVHVHGYDIMRDVAPGQPARFDLRTTIVGRFEIELEDRHKQIGQLTVTP